MNRVLGLSLLLVAVAGYAFAGAVTPRSMRLQVWLPSPWLSGGMVVLWGRRRAK